jgi:uncharacterized protein
VKGIVSGIYGCGIKDFVNYATSNGFRCVVFNYTEKKDISGESQKKYFNPGVTHASSDLEDLFDHIKQKIPKSNLYGVGFSLGSNILVKFCGESKKEYFKALVAISNPFDLNTATKQLLHPLHSKIYDTFFLRDRTKLFMNLDLEPHVLNSVKSTIDLDKISIKFSGHSTVEEFYKDHSCVNFLDKIRVPLICLNSLDDPISHFQSIPFDVSKLNKNIVLAVTEKGGHLGFSEGIFPFFNTSWSERVSIHFLKSVQNKNIDF